mgnify:CR=1 FL=1
MVKLTEWFLPTVATSALCFIVFGLEVLLFSEPTAVMIAPSGTILVIAAFAIFSQRKKCIDADNVAFVNFNVVAGLLHLLSAIAILSLGAPEWKSHGREVSATLWDVTMWQYTCYNRTLEEYTTDRNCDTDDRLFFPEPPKKSLGRWNIILLCAIFSAWSGAVHIAWALRIIRFSDDREAFWKTETTVRFAGDYAVSASVMFVAFSILYSAAELFSVILAPLILFGLLCYSAHYLNTYRGNSEVPKWYGFFSMVAAYTALLTATVFHAIAEITSVVDTDKYGQAPVKVLVISAGITVFVFSSFIVPYTMELYASVKKDTEGLLRQQLFYTTIYCFLSLGAKVTLHVIFTITGLSQSKIIANNTDDAPPDPEQQIRQLAGGASGVVGASIFIFVLLYRRNRPQT